MKKFIKKVSLVKGRLFLSLCFILALNNLYGQYFQGFTPPFDINVGLPHNEINDIVKDERGYVWIATDNGVSRFDGYNFFNFNSTTHPTIFKNNRILKFERNGARFLLLTEGDGLIALDPKTGSFKKVYASNPLALTISNDTTAILFDTGTLLFKVKNKTIFKQTYKIQDKSSLIIHRGNLYVSLNKQMVFAIDPKHPSKRKKIAVADAGQTGDFCTSKKYGIVLWNGDVVRVLKGNRFVEHPDFVGKKLISFYVEEPHGENMYIERSRVPIVNVKGLAIALKFGGQENIQFKSICRINETCFLVSSNQGVLKLLQIPALSKRIDDFSIFQGDQIIVRRRIVEHKNKRYYLGYPHILVGDNDHSLTPFSTQTLTTFDGIIFKNELYCATDGNGLTCVDLTSKKITNLVCDVIGKTESFEDISIYSNTNILLTGGNKVVLYNPTTTKGSAYYLKKGTIVHVAVQQKNSNLIFLGTNNGVFRVRVNTDKKIEFVDFIGKSGIDVRDLLLREEQNEMWLATNNGVFVFDLKKFEMKKTYSTANEVSHPKVVKLLEDKNDCIWAATYFGITVYNTKRGTIEFLNKNHGLINSEFNYKSGCLLKDGRMIFGGLNAYEIINPKVLSDYKYAKSFVISGIEKVKNENEKSFSNYKKGNRIDFSTGKEILKIYLSNLDFQYCKGYTFEYSLDSKNWLKTEKNQCILLSNLSYGDYTLNIRMINPFGQHVSEKTLYLSAKVPYYERKEFLVLIIFLVLFFSALFILFLIRANRIENKTKSKIAMDLHDESGTILTRLIMLSKKEKFEQKEKERLQNGLKEAMFSFRTYLDSLSRKKLNLHDLSDELQEFINSISHETTLKIGYTMQFDVDQTVRAELFRDIKLSIFEVVTNAIKHSKATNLSISFVHKERLLKIKISDDGFCDLTNFNALKGNGIGNLKKRISRNNGTFTFYIEEGMTGLTIEFNIPI